MSKKDIKIGIVGCGASVAMYGTALRYLEEAEVVAWMDPIYKKAEMAAQRYGGKSYLNYDEFLEHRNLNAVINASPSWLHLPQAKQAAESGKHEPSLRR